MSGAPVVLLAGPGSARLEAAALQEAAAAICGSGFDPESNAARRVFRKEHPDLPYLPFGSLRDLLPDVLRARFSDEVASMALQHGETGSDTLLKCYANMPFPRLFSATRELEQFFKPFLEALVAPADQSNAK